MTFRQDTIRVGLVGFFATLAVLSLSLNAYLLWVMKRGGPEGALSRAPAPVAAGDHTRGRSDAKVTLIVYSDFECAFCRDLHQSLRHLATTEDFLWVLRHYPLPNHPNASRYAEACECAGKQGKFWEFADWLFDALAPRPAVVQGPVPPGAALPLNKMAVVSTDTFVETAAAMGLDSGYFRQCLERQQEIARIRAQKEEGDALSITATPTFFVNGRRFVGALELEDLRKLLNGE